MATSDNPHTEYAEGYARSAPMAAVKTNGLAVASLVLGIVWVYWIGSALAVIFGAVAISQIGRSGGTQGGRGLAVAGLVLGLVGLGILFMVSVASAGSA
jgi:hypothetical protein